MRRKLFATAIKLTLGGGVLVIALFADSGILRTSSGFSIAQELNAVFHGGATQWMLVLWLTCYFVLFAVLQHGLNRRWSDFTDVLLFAFAVVAFALDGFTYERASGSTRVLLFLACIVLGKGLLLLIGSKNGSADDNLSAERFLRIMALLLTGSALCRESSGPPFNYRNLERWNGPWDNPNIYGLLMGVAVVLATGLGIRGLRREDRRWRKLFRALLCSLAALFCGIGLFKSYSRGAWLATLIGLGYLLHSALRTRPSILHSPSSILDPATRHPSLVTRTAVILVSLAVLSFWQFRFAEWRPARRVFSVANINDFSWRNRVTAWNGALQMMVHRPWFGYGWGHAGSVYEKKYLPPNLDNGAAIQMNDYFMLGISAGLPALLCFLIYVGLSLRTPHSEIIPHSALRTPHSSAILHPPSSILQATCRSGAIVLLVGFWFDGGLFKLATGSVFWILLELGRADGTTPRSGPGVSPVRTDSAEASSQKSNISEDEPGLAVKSLSPRSNPWLTRAAWIIASLALIQTIILVGTPFLPVNNLTLTIARHWLVPPKAVADLDWLAARERHWTLDIGHWTALRTLIQHASLANYNRQLINWKLDDKTYRDYVLSPIISPSSSAAPKSDEDGSTPELSTSSEWHRRPLWEYFYPPTRHETDPQSAAQIALKFLRERVTIDSGIPTSAGPVSQPSTVDQMWRQRKADPKGFEILTVAAFRSVGIPTRLNSNGQAEVFTEGQWHPQANAMR